MALFTAKEFAEKSGMTTGNLRNYIKRGKVIVLANDHIDDADEVNRSFLAKRESKSDHPAPASIISRKEVLQSGIENTDSSSGEDEIMPEPDQSQSYVESERQLKYLDTIKRRKEIEKLEVDVAKKKGEVIPSELVKPLFLQHNQSIVTEFKNAADEIIRIFSQKKSLSVNEKAEIAGELVSCINSSISKATKLSVKAVKNIILEFAERKGVGERG